MWVFGGCWYAIGFCWDVLVGLLFQVCLWCVGGLWSLVCLFHVCFRFVCVGLIWGLLELGGGPVSRTPVCPSDLHPYQSYLSVCRESPVPYVRFRHQRFHFVKCCVPDEASRLPLLIQDYVQPLRFHFGVRLARLTFEESLVVAQKSFNSCRLLC